MYGNIESDEFGGRFTAGSEELLGWTVEADDLGCRLANGPAENGEDVNESRCALCGETDPDEEGECWSHASEDGRHVIEAATPPLSWVNSARVEARPESDDIIVTISVGDPRGAFVMRAERIVYTNDGGETVEEIRLSVPTPDDTMPHMKLTPLASPGYYRVS